MSVLKGHPMEELCSGRKSGCDALEAKSIRILRTGRDER